MPLAPDHRTRIKICGLTRERDVDDAVDAGVDAVGFVLYEKSPRHVTPERAGQLAARGQELPQTKLLDLDVIDIRSAARQREALHEAIQSGVASAYKFGPDVAMATVKAHVIQYLRESVPGALKALTPGDGVLDTLIERYALAILNKYGEPK